MNEDERSRLSEALRWAVSGALNPEMSTADWLAADIDAQRPTAVELLSDPNTPLRHLEQAKDAFKTLRIVGETSAQRAVGARLYAASIAAALVVHGQRISSQSDMALRRAFQNLLDDPQMPGRLRSLGGQALCALPKQEEGGNGEAGAGAQDGRRGAGRMGRAEREGVLPLEEDEAEDW